MAGETKIEFLDLLSDGRWWTSPEVAYQLGRDLSATSVQLRRYRERGWLRRHKVPTKYNPPRLYEYQITKAGLGHLEYLTCEEVRSGHRASVQLGLGGRDDRLLTKWISDKLGRGLR